MFKFFKRVRQEMKKEAELHRMLTRLARQPLDYEMIQTLINATASNINAVTIDITLADGTKIEMKPAAKKGVDFVPFKERYENRNK